MVKNPPANAGGPGFDPGVGKFPWRRKWQPTPVLLPGESPWAEEPGRPQSMASQRVGQDRASNTFTFTTTFRGLGYALETDDGEPPPTVHTLLEFTVWLGTQPHSCRSLRF